MDGSVCKRVREAQRETEGRRELEMHTRQVKRH